jgi:catechol 2,3-dioxygenase-like lactoylglutathione lyase family enzyme
LIQNLWNIGLKVTNLDREVRFLEAVGARLLLREKLPVGDGLEYAILTLGGTRLLLFPTVIFEDRIEGGVAPGLSHAVYQVDDLDQEYERIKALGAQVLIEPISISAGFGSRRIAFFRSPGGFVFEVMQITEDKLAELENGKR